jgi:DNA-binding HxlR family transcriptional regulator
LLGDLSTMPTRTTLRTLARHVQTLEQLGLVERIGKAAPGKRAVYKLHLPVDNLPP